MSPSPCPIPHHPTRSRQSNSPCVDQIRSFKNDPGVSQIHLNAASPEVSWEQPAASGLNPTRSPSHWKPVHSMRATQLHQRVCRGKSWLSRKVDPENQAQRRQPLVWRSSWVGEVSAHHPTCSTTPQLQVPFLFLFFL